MEWQWGQGLGTVSYAFGIKTVMPKQKTKNVKISHLHHVLLYVAFIQSRNFFILLSVSYYIDSSIFSIFLAFFMIIFLFL